MKFCQNLDAPAVAARKAYNARTAGIWVGSFLNHLNRFIRFWCRCYCGPSLDCVDSVADQVGYLEYLSDIKHLGSQASEYLTGYNLSLELSRTRSF